MVITSPTANPAAPATGTAELPLGTSAVTSTGGRLYSGQRFVMKITGPFSASSRRRVLSGPAPRRTTPLFNRRDFLSRYVPGGSTTTVPSAHPLIALWIASLASALPPPKAAASIVAQTDPRAGIPPRIPGCQRVQRSEGTPI